MNDASSKAGASKPLFLSLTAAADAVARGEITSVALTKAAIDAFRTKDAPLNSLIRLDVEDALETALQALAGLSGNGKLIGVISHVPAIRERIAAQIEVRPLAGGCSELVGPGCARAG